VCTGPSASRTRLWYDALERAGRSADIEPAKCLGYPEWRCLVERHRMPADAHDDDRAVMTREEIADLSRHPLIEIGAHTVDHPVLARASMAVQREQIAVSITTLEAWTGTRPRAFAYPNGRPHLDFTDETVSVVGEAGVDIAFSTQPRVADIDGPPLTVPRFTMLDSISDAQLARNLTASWRRPESTIASRR
jgi:peptidoglycan/xylan/chitin deacetylase (PgdA/CDA1 family)